MSISMNLVPYQRRANFHLIPGRLRIGIPGLLNNQGFANFLAHRFAYFPGVRLSYANPMTGQVLIKFDKDKTDLELLLSQISFIGYPKGEFKASTSIKHRTRKTCNRTKEKLLPIKSSNQTKIKASSTLKYQQHPTGAADSNAIPWYALDNSKILELVKTSVDTGLTELTARHRLNIFGYNELEKGRKMSFWQIAWDSLNGFMSKLLLIAGGVSFLIGETTDAAVIGAIIIIQAIVEAAQSLRAGKSLEKLKQLSDPLTTVLREGEVKRIPTRELVPGDILQLSAGDMVPADARIIEATNLLTNEACLTGESIPVVKDSEGKNEDKVPVAEQSNMLFSGTSIVGGRVAAIVVTTGMKTELGKIAKLLGSVKQEKTNLQLQLDQLGKKITQLVAVSVGIIAFIHFLRGGTLWEVLRAGISLAVGAVPEGLPAVLTVALSTGVQRMVRRNAVVRNMSAVETLGSTTVICADKTGTLTNNKMMVKELYANGDLYEFTGSGYRPEGEILYQGEKIDVKDHPIMAKALKAAALCSDAELTLSQDNEWMVIGDPTEGALLAAAAKGDLWWENLKEEYCRHDEIAFDSQRRTMTVVCREPEGGYGVYVKGAPDAVFNCCSHMLGIEEKKTFDDSFKKQLLKINEQMANRALRVLAIAYKSLPSETDPDKIQLDTDLVFCGLVGMSDNTRKGVREAVQKCLQAGIKVVMITGDHQKTAEAIAEKLGILKQGRSITGKELEEISDDDFAEQVDDIVVYSRTTPEQKLRIVCALKKRGQIVAMTGDGVNDAPAVREANIGIAMGLSGADVTREVAGITLSDDNFVTIVNGIEEGRTVGENLSKSIRFILIGSLSQILTAFTSTALGFPAPLLPSQILWANLVTESIPAMSLTADPPDKNYMNRPPVNPKRGFLQDEGGTILQKGVLFGLNTFALFAYGLKVKGWPLNKARTMAFSQLVVNRVFNLIKERSSVGKGVKMKGENPFILPAAVMTISALAATMYLPFMRPLFSTVPIGLKEWLLLIANAFITGGFDSTLDFGKKSIPLPATVSKYLPVSIV